MSDDYSIISSDSDFTEPFDFILIVICEIEPSRVNEIKKKCNCIVEMLNKINSCDFNMLTEDEKARIIQFGNSQRRAKIDIEEATQLQGDTLSFDKAIEYALSDTKLKDESNKQKRELYDKYRDKFLKIYYFEFNKRLKIQKYGTYLHSGNSSVIYFVKEILPKMIEIAKNNKLVGMTLKGILNSTDELVAFLNQVNPLKANILSGILMFGITSSISIGTNLYKYIKGQIRWKDFLWFSGVEIAVHGASCVSVTGCALVGGAIGSVIPFIGTAIGSIVGGLVGLFVSKKIVEPCIISKLQKSLIPKDFEENLSLEMYKDSLKKFNVEENDKVEAIKAMRKVYNLRYHPDKNISDQMVLDEKSSKFIEMETHYRIIEGFRKANNTWE